MRLFVAIDIDDHIRSRLQRFVEGVLSFAPDARWASPQSLHITLKFIGEMPESALEKIKAALLCIKSSIESGPLQIAFRGYGFFPSQKRPRIFWIGVEAAPELAALATAVDQALLPLGMPKETHAFNPHITLARARGSGSQMDTTTRISPFGRLQEKLAALSTVEFGTMTARDFFLYESRPSASGSVYKKIATFKLGRE